MKIQKIYYKFLGALIHSTMIILLLACGKPETESKSNLTDGIRTEIDEEMEVLTNSSPKIEKRLLSKAKIISIRIYPKNVLNPIEEVDRIVQGNCGRGDWDRNEVYYDKTKVSWKNYTQSFAMLIKNDLRFKANSPNGGNINASLDELIKAKGASISTNPNYVEIKLPSKEWPTALGREELDIELSLNPTKTAINVGSMREVRRVCTRSPRDPPRGADGGRGGGMYKSFIDMSYSSSGVGFSSQVFEVQYDLEVFFVSEY